MVETELSCCGAEFAVEVFCSSAGVSSLVVGVSSSALFSSGAAVSSGALVSSAAGSAVGTGVAVEPVGVLLEQPVTISMQATRINARITRILDFIVKNLLAVLDMAKGERARGTGPLSTADVSIITQIFNCASPFYRIAILFLEEWIFCQRTKIEMCPQNKDACAVCVTNGQENIPY